MKAIVLQQYGPPESLEFSEIPQPAMRPGEVLVKIHASGVNLLDIAKASGAMKDQFPLSFPWIPGIDFAGVVEHTGDGKHAYKIGDAVYGTQLDGGAFAEYIAVPPENITLKPERLSFNEAASVPVAAITAWQMLFQHEQSIQGKTILIHGAAGAVGAYAVQLAHHAGATVIATANEADTTYLQELGAAQVIDRHQPFESMIKDVDLVIDLVGKDVQDRSFKIIKKDGFLLASNQPPSAERAAAAGIHAMFFQFKSSGLDLLRITGMFDAGKLKSNVAASYSLKDVTAAWNEQLQKGSQQKKKQGRIVLNHE